MATTCSIPVIDLHDFPNESSKLIAACEEWGCFRLLNHHDILPSTLMSEMNSVARSLFDLPIEIKRRNLDVTVGRGHMVGATKSPLYEAFGLYDIPFRYDVETFCSQLDLTPHQRYSLSPSPSPTPYVCVSVSVLESLVLTTDIRQRDPFFNMSLWGVDKEKKNRSHWINLDGQRCMI